MKALHMVAFALAMIGALNWGLVGVGELAGTAGGWNMVHMVVGQWPMIESIVYVLVGLSAVLLISTHMKDCRHCSADGGMAKSM